MMAADMASCSRAHLSTRSKTSSSLSPSSSPLAAASMHPAGCHVKSSSSHPLLMLLPACLLLLLYPSPHAYTAMLPALAAAGEEKADFARPLTADTFQSTLEASTSPWALVEFFASWCPACQHFKPEYEKVARIFNSPQTPYRGFIFVAKVDCATEGALCERFAIHHYPTMLWATPGTMAIGKRASSEDHSMVEQVEGERSAAGVLKWINERVHRKFDLAVSFSPVPDSLLPRVIEGELQEGMEEKREGTGAARFGARETEDEPPSLDASKKVFQHVALHDVEEATAVAYNFIFSALRLSSDMRAPLLNFLSLLSKNHPSPSCRMGSGQIVAHFPAWWPSSAGRASAMMGINAAAFAAAKICGPSKPTGNWEMCAGSRKDTRGYSCGLWLLFHSLAAAAADESGGEVMEAVHSFVNHFFGCSTCRDHFLQMAKDLGMDAVGSKREAVLWLWSAHNRVNARLAREEAESGGQRGDPAFPKQQFPSEELCPACRRKASLSSARNGGAVGHEDQSAVQWDEDATYAFLLRFYGNTEGSGGEQRLADTNAAIRLEEKAAAGSPAAKEGGSSIFWLAVMGLLVLGIAAGLLGIFFSFCMPTPSRRRKLRGRPQQRAFGGTSHLL